MPSHQDASTALISQPPETVVPPITTDQQISGQAAERGLAESQAPSNSELVILRFESCHVEDCYKWDDQEEEGDPAEQTDEEPVSE